MVTRAYRAQNTLRNPSFYKGIGIHTGHEVSLRFLPAPLGTGIVFRRSDLPGHPTLPATLENVVDTTRSTTLGLGDVRVHTVEHVLAACKAYRIDHLIIEVSNEEPPVGNGSSDIFVAMIEEAGIEPLDEEAEVFCVEEPLFYSEADVHLVALPYPGWKISYTLHYPESGALEAQYYVSEIDAATFAKEIAPCRTFSRYKEVALLMDRGLIKGGSLDNAVVVQGEAVFSKGGLRFPNEMARHKVLDLIGDLSLLGCDIRGHFIGICSGHRSNFALAQEINERRRCGTHLFC